MMDIRIKMAHNISSPVGNLSIVQTCATTNRTVPIPKKHINELRTAKYEARIEERIFSFVTLSVFGVMAMLIPTENITPATVYIVFNTSSLTLMVVKADKTPANTIEKAR